MINIQKYELISSGAVCCLRREKRDNAALTWGMRRVFGPVGPLPEQ